MRTLIAGFGVSIVVVTILLSAGPAVSTPDVLSLSAFCNGNDAVDDTACMRAWMEAARTTGARDLYVPPGEFLYSGTVPLHSGVHLRCAGPGPSVFRNNGSPGDLFFTSDAVRNVIVENCAFDVRAGNKNFLAVIAVNSSAAAARNIHIRSNRFFDSAIPGQPSKPQRQYIFLSPCEDCWIEGNHLSEGGRIKVGRPGRRLFIRNNVVEHTNDNAITVVDVGTGTSRNIVIDGNVIIDPIGVGIFFGADGQSETDQALSSANVQISGNIVRGNWKLSCIRGVLPAKAERFHVVHNICTKTGSTTEAGGIDILRPDRSPGYAQDTLIGFNTIGVEGAAKLDVGGIFVRGSHRGFRVLGNAVRNVGGRAIRFANMDVHDAVVADNVLAGGSLVIDGRFVGAVTNNVISNSADVGMQFVADTNETISASVTHNVVRNPALECIRFDGSGKYEIDLVDNTLANCHGPRPVVFFGPAELAPGSRRFHNKGDIAPHAAPTGHLMAAAPWTTGVVAPGATRGVDVTVKGAKPGNIAGAAFGSITTGDWHISAYVRTADTVHVVITNHTAAAADPGTLRVHVWAFE